MSTGILDFEWNPWWFVAAIGLGLTYAVIMYSQKAPWGKTTNIWLAVLRFILSSSLAILLLGLTVHSFIRITERPIMAIALDNSESMALTSDSTTLNQLTTIVEQLVNKLSDEGYDTDILTLSDQLTSLDEVSFDENRSDLTGLIGKVRDQNEGLNLTGIVLISDGIYNSGFSPDLISGSTPLYTIGVGDTTELKDLSIIEVRYNKTVFQGNSFPLEVDVRNVGITSNRMTISILQNNRVLDAYTVAISPEDRIVSHRFQLEVENTGKQRYDIRIAPHEDELTIINNSNTVYIDIIEGKQKILIVSGAVHPDVKALKQAIEKNEHFAVDLAEGAEDENDYDLLIFYQYPTWNRKRADFNRLINSPRTAKLFVTGLNTDMNWLRANGVLDFQPINRKGDQVAAYIAEPFTTFNLTSETQEWLPKTPPVFVPYGNIALGGNDVVLMKQQIGAVTTDKPLLFFKNTDPKVGFFMAENFWRWRLDEYRLDGTQDKFDELIGKTVQYLASKPDNRQFKMYPVKDVFELGEPALLNAELYNELFEPIYGNEVQLKIRKEGSSELSEYRYTPLPGSSQFNASELSEGIYNFTAETVLNGKKNTVNGQFIIEKLDLEAVDLTADYKVLRNIANKSQGKFYRADEIDGFLNDIESMNASAIIHSREKEQSLLNFYWLMIALILLASLEWFQRKFYGGY